MGKSNKEQGNRELSGWVMGVDLGGDRSEFCVLDERGRVVRRGRVKMSLEEVRRQLGGLPRLRAAVESGGQSRWFSRALRGLGHRVTVCDSRRLALISASGQKSDRRDAELLARLLLADAGLLAPVAHRGEEAQRALSVLRARDLLVRQRAACINLVRSLCREWGVRLAKCSAECFAKKAAGQVPEAAREAARPLVEAIAQLTARIEGMDQWVERACEEQFPETELLRQVQGVGALTALAYVLTVDRPWRFAKARDVGAWLGLTRRRRQSGESDPRLGISKAGDGFLRRLMVGSAHYILGPFGPDCDLRRHGERIAGRGGDNARKRAVVAVARKLSVLLLHLWRDGLVYDPDHLLKQRAGREAA